MVIGLLVLLIGSWFSLEVTDTLTNFGFVLPALMVAAGVALLMRKPDGSGASRRSHVQAHNRKRHPLPRPAHRPPTQLDDTDQLPVLYDADGEPPQDSTGFSFPESPPPPPPSNHDGQPSIGRIVLGVLLFVRRGGHHWSPLRLVRHRRHAGTGDLGPDRRRRAHPLGILGTRGRGLIPLGILLIIAASISAVAAPFIEDGIGERSHRPTGIVGDLAYETRHR